MPPAAEPAGQNAAAAWVPNCTPVLVAGIVSPAVGQSTMCRQVGSQSPSHWLIPPKKSGATR